MNTNTHNNSATQKTKPLGLRDQTKQTRYERAAAEVRRLVLPRLCSKLETERIIMLDSQTAELERVLDAESRIDAVASVQLRKCNSKRVRGWLPLAIKTTRTNHQLRRPAYRLGLSLGVVGEIAQDLDILTRLRDQPLLLGPSVMVLATLANIGKPTERAYLYTCTIADLVSVATSALELESKRRKLQGKPTVAASVRAGEYLDLGHVCVKPSNTEGAYLEIDTWSVPEYKPGASQ